MKNYKSELINKILEERGHEMSTLHYESECIETWINEEKGAYPKLTDYESEWLNYIIENPIGEFPYETITDVTDATVDNVVPYGYKSAILKGSTKYRDIDTGDILDTFDETKNLELVSVKVPVLTTTGKNLFDGELMLGNVAGGNGIDLNSNQMCRTNYIKVTPCSDFTASIEGNYVVEKISEVDKDKNFIKTTEKNIPSVSVTLTNSTSFIRCVFNHINNPNEFSLDEVRESKIQLEESPIATPYEPYKSNILTVNEDVTLRSNGNICDELNLLTGQLTQRIDEDGEVLSQEVVTTVNLSVIDQDGNTLSQIKPLEGTMHISTDGTPLKPTVSMEIPVEAITQNLCSFIEEE